jgi:hypothetical protein
LKIRIRGGKMERLYKIYIDVVRDNINPVLFAALFLLFLLIAGNVRAQILLEDGFEEETLNTEIWDVTWWTPDGQLPEGIDPEIVDYPVREGKHAVKIRAQANWNGHENYSRTEILGKRNDNGSFSSFFFPGKEYWLGFSVYLPKDWQTDNKSKEVVFQLHGNSGGGQYGIPPLALTIDGTDWYWGISSDQDSTPDTHEEYGRTPLIKGEWVDFVIHAKFSYENDGYGLYEFWRNGDTLFTREGPNCYWATVRGPQTGIYKWDWSQSGVYDVSDRTMYLDEVTVGDASSSYEEVAPGDTLPQNDHVIAHWKLDKDSTDCTGNGNNGSPVNVTYSADATVGAYSGYFNGGAWMTLPNDIGQEEIKTITLWMKREGADIGGAGYSYVIRKQMLLIDVIDNNKLRFKAGDISASKENYVTDSVWIHVAGVIDGSGVKLYADGELIAEDSGTTNLVNTEDVFVLGGGFESDWAAFNGKIDDVILWDTALTADEIKEVMDRGVVSSIEEFSDRNKVKRPVEFKIGNYPNPFNPSTTISYELPESGDISIKVYDVTGALVTELVHAKKSAGSYSVKWNGKTASGVQATSGVYIYSMRCNGKIKSGKMILMK